MVYDLSLEKTILSSLLCDNRLIIGCLISIKPTYFYSTENKMIYSTMVNLYEKSSSFDFTAINSMTENKYFERISEIVDHESSSNIKIHIKIFTELFKKRYMQNICNKILQNIESGGSNKESINLMSECSMQMSINKNKLPISAHKLVSEMFDDIEKRQQTKGVGIKTGFTDLDNRINGLNKKQLILIAGRPGTGKSVLALNIAANISYHEDKVALVINLEMDNLQSLYRIVSEQGDIDKDTLLKGRILREKDREKLSLVSNKIYEKENKLFLYDVGTLTVEEIKAITKMYVNKYGVNVLIVDYLQLISNSGLSKGEQHHEVEHKARQLKLLAKDLDINVIALSQLNRKCEDRSGEDKRPKLSDLRDSGALEQDADVVLFTYQPFRHKNNLYGTDRKASIFEAEILTSKVREGVPGVDHVGWDGSKAKFYNIKIENPDSDERGEF